jgi:hypothetical protein
MKMTQKKRPWIDAYYGKDAKRYAGSTWWKKDPERKLRNLLESDEYRFKERVERAFKSWNQRIREQLRQETALRLSDGGRVQSVPVKIEDGLPDPLDDIIVSHSEIWLLLHATLIKQTAEGLKLIERYYQSLSALELMQPVPATRVEIHNSKEFTQKLADIIARTSIKRKIKEIDSDVLGAYFFRIPKIELYWMAIAIYSTVLEIPVETLTVIVAIHELAHAYTHLGLDIDGLRWKTLAFAETDLFIVEGLAQFYTETICEKLDAKIPGIANAFGTLLKHQSAPYTKYQEWISGPNAKKGEIIRASTIETRIHGITDHQSFKDLVSGHEDRLRNTA